MEPYNPIYDDCTECGGKGCDACENRQFVLSQTARAQLDAGAAWVSDHINMDRDELAEGASFAELFNIPQWLPAVYARHYTPEMLDRFQLAIKAARDKLKQPEAYLACTAEELAAHAILDEADGFGEDWDDPEAQQQFSFTDFARARADIRWLKDIAFEDHDVLLLFDARMDGIEDSSLADQMGFANLSAPDWFKPFRSDDDGEDELHQLPTRARE
jgi:hypothetical protein